MADNRKLYYQPKQHKFTEDSSTPYQYIDPLLPLINNKIKENE